MNTEPQVRHITKLVRECNLAADVEVRVVENAQGIVEGPCLPPEEAKKLDAVCCALRAGDICTASRMGRYVYVLISIKLNMYRRSGEDWL